MRTCASLRVNLTGGPHDGEVALLSPDPGVGPPQLLCYYANRREGEDATYVMDVYEIWPPIATYPDFDGTNALVECKAIHQGVASLQFRASGQKASGGAA